MAVSARNQLTGTVSAVATGAVNDEVELTLAGGAKLVAIVTHSSQQALGLAKGKEAIALIKAPWVTLATEDCGLKFSARNQFAGSVSQVTEGAVNATVHIKTDAGFEIVAVVTNETESGKPCCCADQSLSYSDCHQSVVAIHHHMAKLPDGAMCIGPTRQMHLFS